MNDYKLIIHIVMKTTLKTIAIVLLLFAFSMPYASAQKKGKAQAKAAPKEDFSLYLDNPICQVVITDSVVVPISETFRSIPFPSYLGRLFASAEDGGRITYENDFGDQRMFAETDENGRHNIYRQTLLGDKWGEPELVRINGSFIDIINPFPMPDGQTLYFAARSEEDNNGNSFSLYTTTFDTETMSYLAPQRLPFPFVSSASDLYYIEDETDSIAWLATTRRQPEGMICIYTMQNKQPWSYYDVEETEPARLKSYALIEHISDTWPSESEKNLINKRIAEVLKDAQQTEVASTESKEPVARKNIRIKIENLERQLSEYRLMYSRSDLDNKNRLADTIRESEQELKGLYSELRKM